MSAYRWKTRSTTQGAYRFTTSAIALIGTILKKALSSIGL